jgi:uncharacterized SAM-binding protein YcdF (DUF218 family)
MAPGEDMCRKIACRDGFSNQTVTAPRLRSRLVLSLVALLVVAAAVAIAVPALGVWLVVADTLSPSDAIFVLEGRTPAREVEAAALYHRGLARVVGISRARDSTAIARELARLPAGPEVAATALKNLGVPPEAIVRLEREVQNTLEEVAAIAEICRARGYTRVILVSSPSHTRRIRIIWEARVPGITALVHPTSYEAFDGHRWWRSRRGIETVLHEVGGIVNFRLGSVLPTFDDGDR